MRKLQWNSQSPKQGKLIWQKTFSLQAWLKKFHVIKTDQNSAECGAEEELMDCQLEHVTVCGIPLSRKVDVSDLAASFSFGSFSPAHHISSLSTCVCILDWPAPNRASLPCPL